MKKTETRSFSLALPVSEELDKLAAELNVTPTALVNALISIVSKWNLKEMFKDAIPRR